MARKGDIKFIPAVNAAATGAGYSLEDIPQDIKDEIEEMYAALKTRDGRFQVAFDTKAELAEYVAMVTAYCAQRLVDGNAAPIRFRKSPTKGLPETTMNFRITDVQTENEKATEAVRDATDAVKEAAKDATPAPAKSTRKR